MNSHYIRFFRHLRAGRYFHPGAGRLLKSYGYVGNIAHQLERFLLAEGSQVHRRMFYIADYEPISLPKWIDQIALQLGSRRPLTLPLPLCRGLARVGDLLQWAGVGRLLPFNSFRLDNILAEYTYDLSETRAICGELPFNYAVGVSELADWIRADFYGK
jgi:hypothetical protein